MTGEFEEFQAACRERVDQAMKRHIDTVDFPCSGLEKAVRYVLPGGGKRVRPLLIYAGCQALGGDFEDADDAASAVEFIHVYSLIHDDLPALDDDDLRRGRPSLHKAFDEATAILAGDALQSMAFEILCRPHAAGKGDRLRMARELAQATGPAGMIGGQSRDLAADGQRISLDELETIHLLKTGALIRASVLLGALSSGKATPGKLERLSEYAGHIGLAFQVQDDVLDEVSDTGTLGKPQGSDRDGDKATYVALLGLDSARARAADLAANATAALGEFGADADPLRHLAAYIIERIN